MTEIKICGLRREEDIEAANALLPDYIGFVFAKSRRQVTAEQACRLRANLDGRVRAVGVFVNESTEKVAETAKICSLFAVQLHGDENADYIGKLRPLLPQNCEIWKAARVQTAGHIVRAAETGADRLILDAFSKDAYGGTGMKFDWSLLKSTKIDRPFFVAGGMTPENAAEAVQAAKQAGLPFGIDVSGGVETDGFKDYTKMAALISNIRILQ